MLLARLRSLAPVLLAAACESARADARGPAPGTRETEAPAAASEVSPRGDARDSGPYLAARLRMVEKTIAARGVTDPLVLRAMRTVKRHLFVPERRRHLSYIDDPLPIGHGQTISQPYLVAVMTEAAHVGRESSALEIGTGSGYGAAVLAEIAAEVYTIEIVPALARTAAERLKALGYADVRVRCGDGYAGWSEHAPFDAIIVTCAPDHVPGPLVEQLKVGGRLVIPVGPRAERLGFAEGQWLKVVTKTAEGAVEEDILSVRFVPMTGEAERKSRGRD